jgi:hypothetical protein
VTVDLATKSRVFALLKARGATKAVLSYNGGNDEGGVDEIALYSRLDGGDIQVPVDFPTVWNATGEDRELAELLEAPVDAKYGSWAGDFSAYGTLTWDVEKGTVVMDDYEQSGYDHSHEAW